MGIFARVGIALAAAMALSFAATPAVKLFAELVGAIDVPNDARRVHKHPIPRLGGLAIFIGFVLSVVLLAEIDRQVQGILLGAVVVVALGVIDDIMPLPALLKFVVQILAALVAVFHGVVIEILSNPFFFIDAEYIGFGILTIPITVLWIVAITNSVNLIDGLDGLAVGVSTISSIVMLIIALMVADQNVAVMLAALTGACIGFLPFNFNPAKIFMGDTGSFALGGFVISITVMLRMPLVLAIVGFVYIAQNLSVILQTRWFKYTKKKYGEGRRIFRMAPLHHHFEQLGMKETQVVGMFYIVTAICCLIGYIATRGLFV
jgi:UDP-GlcNAc:undecaprenyl-phosphate GlcNAc-1-phosphate transferase